MKLCGGCEAIFLCSPLAFVDEVVRRMRGKTKALSRIHKIGWGNVLHVKPVQLEKGLVSFLLDMWQVPKQRFVINEEEIDIKLYVEKVVGVPNCGSAVNNKGKHGDLDERLYTALTIEGKGKSLQCSSDDALELLDDEDIEERDYCIYFILHAFGHYLGPLSGRVLERQFLRFFKDVSVENFKKKKWCDLIADILIGGLNTYKANLAKFRKCWECVLVLVAIFFDSVSEEIRDKDFPRANHITNEDLEKLSSMSVEELKILAKKAKPINETLYNKDYKVVA